MDELEKAYGNAEELGAVYWQRRVEADLLDEALSLLDEANRIILPADVSEKLEELISLVEYHYRTAKISRDVAEDEYQAACDVRDSLEEKLV